MQNEIEELFQKLKPKLGKQIDDLWLVWASDPKSKQEVEGLLRLLAAKYLDETYEKKKILLAPIPEDLAKGDYFFGTVMYGDDEKYPFYLRENELIQHLFIAGRTGSGKTNSTLLLLKGLLRKGKPFLVLDWKRNYRDILNWQEAGDVLVFTAGRNISPFRFNPLIPPHGTQIDVWIKRMIDILCGTFYLGEGVAFLLMKAMKECYEEKLRASEGKEYPTFQNIRNWLANYKARGREGQWYDSTRRAIESLCFGSTGDIFNTQNNLGLEELLQKQVIWELDTLSSSEKAFLIESFLLWIHHFRMQEEHRESHKHTLVLEEAHHVLLKSKNSKENITDVILREVREFGQAIVLIDQHPSLISVPALGNTFCTVAMNLKHSADTKALANAMLLNEEGREALGKLPVGYGIIRLQDRFRKPFLVRFPKVEIEKGSVTDEILKSKMAGYFSNPADILSKETEPADILPILSNDKIEETKLTITEPEKKMLLDVMQNPFEGVADRYRKLSFSSFVGNKIKGKLVTDGFLIPVKVPIGKGALTLFELTDKAKEALRNMGYEPPPVRGKEGMVHRYLKNRAGEWFRKHGYSVTYEYPIGEGKAVDIVIEKNGKKIAVEIETGKSQSTENIIKCEKVGFNKILIITNNEKIHLPNL